MSDLVERLRRPQSDCEVTRERIESLRIQRDTALEEVSRQTAKVCELERGLAEWVADFKELQAERDRLAAIVERLAWRPVADHPDEFEDSDSYLVAVPVSHGGGVPYWELSLIVVKCDEEYFNIETAGGDPWGWDWDCVAWFICTRDLCRELPEAAKECHDGER